MLARRDAALDAVLDEAAVVAHVARIEAGAEARREGLLELELLLGLDSPPEFQAQRLALQVRKLRDRFKSTATTSGDSAGDRLLAWCARPGVADAGDRQRCDRIVSKLAQMR